MKVAEILERRRKHWHELERLCIDLKQPGHRLSAPEMVRFATLYRAACADLALADAYHLPQNTVHYLHRLVGRAHNMLYRSRRFNVAEWANILLNDVPQTDLLRSLRAVFVCLVLGLVHSLRLSRGVADCLAGLR
jgi:hypothetical protein